MTAIFEPSARAADVTPYSDLTLKQVIQTIPKVYFQKDPRKAWAAVALSVGAVTLGYVAIAFSPWFLLPFAWFLTGTALTGFFVVGHDCGHRSFANRRWVNNWLGHIMFLPLIYPFHSWRLLHDIHHRHTNNMEIDNAWAPWSKEEYTGAGGFLQTVYKNMRGWLWWLASVVHWGALHFDLRNFEPRDHGKVKRSIAAVVIFALVFFPTLFYFAGPWGVVKFWLMPWLGYHFWMSTFTLVHHTIPEIQFRYGDTWNEVESQLSGTLHCDYPKWIEVLCHDINVHVPHHVSVGIPSYNLRPAYAALKENWSPLMKETKFSWELMRTITSRCHIYHPERAYETFRELGQ
ncbi:MULTISPECIES: fatty acid desaturase [Cyanophyceae]|uniref:Fatty acid desaturase n=1 Tax=Leptolyngbya subtilissima DQ-A4 TaxID=2933933 RepID=A0ABV0K544_9CYAN|nr:fatty acid desaturase [Nodosilinea sp. FACHB-141]MBD2112835.1 fatty acid desaturase [Nodosilinea sp. FACHB-141]